MKYSYVFVVMGILVLTCLVCSSYQFENQHNDYVDSLGDSTIFIDDGIEIVDSVDYDSIIVVEEVVEEVADEVIEELVEEVAEEVVEEYDPDYDADYEVVSVAGVKFNDIRYNVVSKLKERFGYDNIKDNGSVFTVYEPNIGGINFKYADFFFNNSRLIAATLVKNFKLSEFNLAKKDRDAIAQQYGLKYKNIKSKIDKNGIKYYICGMVENNRYPIIITLRKGLSNGGTTYYYLEVRYFDILPSLNSDI